MSNRRYCEVLHVDLRNEYAYLTIKSFSAVQMNQSFLRFLRWSYLYDVWPKPKEPVSRSLRANLRKGDIVFDVGANCGFTALEISGIVGRKGKVFSFEPNDQMFEQCKIIERLNLFQNIKFFNYGIGSENTERAFFIDTRDSSQASTFDDLFLHAEKKLRGDDLFIETQAQIKKLDDLDLPSPNLIKLDIEGHELEALRGTEVLIKRDQPRIVFEFFFNDSNPQFQQRKSELISFFYNLNYQLEIFHVWNGHQLSRLNNKISVENDFLEYTGCDILATPQI